MREPKPFFTLILFILLLASNVQPALAQDGAWGEVVNPDGSINYGNLIDGGVVTDPGAGWMPSIPLIGSIPAEYHVYTTPSGNSVVLPNATTLFFMALNPQESGLTSAASQLANGQGGLIEALGGYLSPSTLSQLGYVSGSQFFSDVISGETNIWTIGGGMFNLMQDLYRASATDLNLYTTLLLYTPDVCGGSPVGCTPEQLALLATLVPPDDTPLPPEPISCPAPQVIPGKITRNGTLVSPNYPLVVGQDPDKTGVTVQFSASVAPTIYEYWTLEPVEECSPRPWPQTGQDCEIVDWTCEQHTQTYPECISIASGSLRLTQESKDWILNTLSIRYPGAYVHKDSFAFPASSACSWSYTAPNAQVADPGEWDIYVNGQTSGTPVSDARPFGGKVGSFDAWLKETAIIK